MRLITRSDFDGLACGVLLRELGIIDSCKFVHPKDVQDGLIELGDDDVLANIPYMKGAKLWFDHHISEQTRLENVPIECGGKSQLADSAARVVFEYYGGRKALPHLEEMVKAVDKVDSAKLDADDILSPSDWILLGFIMDPRTGLGRFHNFRISNYVLMENLMDICRSTSITDILKNPDVKERVDLYFEQNKLFEGMIRNNTRTDGNVILTDLRGVDPIFTGNRFLIYCMYPKQNLSIWIVDGKGKKNCPIAVGHSIINRTSNVNVGKLLLKFGGGGHTRVGTCQVPYSYADEVVKKIVEVSHALDGKRTGVNQSE